MLPVVNIGVIEKLRGRDAERPADLFDCLQGCVVTGVENAVKGGQRKTQLVGVGAIRQLAFHFLDLALQSSCWIHPARK